MLKFATRSQLTHARLLSKFATANEALKLKGDITNLTNLGNGFRIASCMNNRPTATIGIWIDAGSRYETPENNGVGMVLENILHTGSAKRNSIQLQKELAKNGANLMSYTTRTNCALFVECLSDDVERVLEMLADLMCNTDIDTAKLEEQRAISIKRLEMFDDNHKGVVMDQLHMTAFQGTPMALSPLGNNTALNSVTVETVKNHANDIFKPFHMVLSCVGGILSHESLHRMAEKYFGHLENNYERKIPLNIPPPSHTEHDYVNNKSVRFTGSEFVYRDDNYPGIYGALAVEGVPFGHLDYLPLELAKTYVGQWNRTHATSLNAPSTIVQKMSTNSEITAYESFNLSYDNTGLFGVYFVLKGTNIGLGTNAVKEVQRGWKHLAVSVTDDEIDRAKNALKTNLFSSLESNTQIANYIANEVLTTGKITPLETLERKIHYIDATTVQEAVSRHIYDREIAFAGTGRTETWPLYHDMRYAMSWWRL